MSSWFDSTAVYTYIMNKEKGRQKLYALCRRDENGNIECMIDESMVSMGWSKNSLCAFKQPPLHYYNKESNQFIIRLYSKKSPIIIDMTKRASRQRNILFSEKRNI